MRLVVDPADPADPTRPTADGREIVLIPADGEYRATVDGLGREATAAVPGHLYLQIYAYEVLERMRERQLGPSWRDETWRIPFWPACLFEAADVTAHPGREIEALFPRCDAVRAVDRSERVLVDAAVDWLGAARFDPAAYRRSLDAVARGNGWELTPP